MSTKIRSSTAKEEQGEEDLQTVFPTYFTNQINGTLALWILANGQTTIEGAGRLFPFRTSAKKTELSNRVFDYTNYRHRTIENNTDEVREMGQSENKFALNFREQLAGALEGLPQPTKHLLHTGIQEKFNSLLFDLKAQDLENGEKFYEESKTEYLVKLIKTIIEKLGKEHEEGVPEKIIAYGGVESVLNTSLFSSDGFFKNKFKTIINSLKTFSQLRIYGGKDIAAERNKLIDSISTCLIKLRFDEKVAQQICNKLLQEPLSNIVALRPDLTNKQKQNYYNSGFYQSGQLKAYAQILGYSDSLEFRVKQDVAKIFAAIEDVVKISREIVENVLGFNFYGLFKISTIKHLKVSIYKTVINECPNFLNAFKLITYQSKSPASLRENERINQKMELINVFFKINLPFQQWDKAQNKILSRDYSIVDDLTLKLQSKHTLLQHILQKVQPFFHSIDKPVEYRTEVEHAILELIMDTKLSELSFDDIFNIITETLSGETGYRSESVGELGKGQITAYENVLKKCGPYNEYRNNKGRDIQQEKYQKSWQLRKQIYEINLEDRIDVSYQNIGEFIEKVIGDGVKIPKTYIKYITDLSKLRGDPIVVEEQDPQPISQQSNNNNNEPLTPVKPAGESPEQLNKKFNEFTQKFFNKYIEAGEDSMFQKAYNDKFGQNKVTLVRKVIEGNAFNDQNSSFFTELAFNNVLTKRIKGQFQKNAATFATEISEGSSLLQKIGSAGGSAPQSSTPDLAKSESSGPSKAKADEFINKYSNDNQDSLLQKAYNEKYGKDSLKLVKDLIELNAFGNAGSSFFTNLQMNNVLTKRIKGELQRNAAWAVPMLNALK